MTVLFCISDNFYSVAKYIMVKVKLPKELIVYHNVEKVHNESWTQSKSKNPSNFPCPYQCLLLGTMNSGKSNVVRNLLVQQKPRFERVMIWVNPSSTEWNDLFDHGAERFEHMPTEDEIVSGKDSKQVLVIDDINLKSHDPVKFTTLLRNYSSHFNMSVIMTCHDFVKNLQAENRRLFNVYCIYKSPDMLATAQLAMKLGLSSDNLKHIMYNKDLIKTHYDFLTIDCTNGTPFPIRISLFNPLDIIEHENGPTEMILYKNVRDYLANKK